MSFVYVGAWNMQTLSNHKIPAGDTIVTVLWVGGESLDTIQH